MTATANEYHDVFIHTYSLGDLTWAYVGLFILMGAGFFLSVTDRVKTQLQVIAANFLLFSSMIAFMGMLIFPVVTLTTMQDNIAHNMQTKYHATLSSCSNPASLDEPHDCVLTFDNGAEDVYELYFDRSSSEPFITAMKPRPQAPTVEELNSK